MIIRDTELTKLERGNRKQPLAFASGCFDLIHSGHIYFLQQMHKFAPGADNLIVIHSDKYVKEKKGEARPVFNQEHRALILSQIKHVDYVHVWDGWETIVDLVRRIRPEHLVTNEHNLEASDWEDNWHNVASEIGAELHGVPRVDADISTSGFIEKIRGHQ